MRSETSDQQLPRSRRARMAITLTYERARLRAVQLATGPVIVVFQTSFRSAGPSKRTGELRFVPRAAIVLQGA